MKGLFQTLTCDLESKIRYDLKDERFKAEVVISQCFLWGRKVISKPRKRSSKLTSRHMNVYS